MHHKSILHKVQLIRTKTRSIGVAYTVGCPISFNNYLDFSSMPLFLILLLFMYMNMRNVPENNTNLMLLDKQDEAPKVGKNEMLV